MKREHPNYSNIMQSVLVFTNTVILIEMTNCYVYPIVWLISASTFLLFDQLE